jgi:hypothetical protein
MQRYSPDLFRQRIFVFGSNLMGRHGKGAAAFARTYCGAIYGDATGLQGRSYAIPTKDRHLRSLPLGTIQECVHEFVDFARASPDMSFYVTEIGCGLAGYSPEDIAPMFEDCLGENHIILPDSFSRILRP